MICIIRWWSLCASEPACAWISSLAAVNHTHNPRSQRAQPVEQVCVTPPRGQRGCPDGVWGSRGLPQRAALHFQVGPCVDVSSLDVRVPEDVPDVNEADTG